MPTVQDLANDVLLELLEPGVNFGGLPKTDPAAVFSFQVILYKLNDALNDFVRRTGYAPRLSEAYVVAPVTAGPDFALPANVRSLLRVEYGAGTTGNLQPLTPLTFDEYDAETGLVSTALGSGLPRMYRMPYGPGAGSIRFNPYPTIDNVTAGDRIGLYYTADPLTLALGTDVPGIPTPYHEALVSFVLSRLWMRKNDLNFAKMHLDNYEIAVKDAKAEFFNVNQEATFAFQDDDDTIDVAARSGFR